MSEASYEVVFSRRAAKAKGFANNAGEKIPENISEAMMETGLIRGLTPEDVPQFLLDWIERMEEDYGNISSSVEPKYSPLERRHNTVFPIKSHDYKTGKVTETIVDLSKLDDEELDDYLFAIPEATSEIVYRQLSSKIANNNQ